MKAELNALCDKVVSLNKEMHETLVKYVNANGGIIRTENPMHDTIYGYIWDEGDLTYKEHPIVAVAVFDESSLAILVDETDGHTSYAGESDEEILENDNWCTIFGGLVNQNITLYNLCECLWEYVAESVTEL